MPSINFVFVDDDDVDSVSSSPFVSRGMARRFGVLAAVLGRTRGILANAAQTEATRASGVWISVAGGILIGLNLIFLIVLFLSDFRSIHTFRRGCSGCVECGSGFEELFVNVLFGFEVMHDLSTVRTGALIPAGFTSGRYTFDGTADGLATGGLLS